MLSAETSTAIHFSSWWGPITPEKRRGFWLLTMAYAGQGFCHHYYITSSEISQNFLHCHIQPDPRRDFKIDRPVSWLLWKFQSVCYKTIFVMPHHSWVPSTLSSFQHNPKGRLLPWAFSALSCPVMSSLICSSYWGGPSAFWLVACLITQFISWHCSCSSVCWHFTPGRRLGTFSYFAHDVYKRV